MRAFLAACALVLSCAAAAQPEEHEVKAAFLFNFLSFVEWPGEALAGGAPLAIGVVGAEDVAQELEQIVPGRSAQGRPVVVRRLREGDSLTPFHMVFFGKGQRARLLDLVRAVPTQPLLIVCDWAGALESGAVVNFLRTEGRVRFEVALDAAGRRNLRISPRMLAVAQAVKPGRM